MKKLRKALSLLLVGIIAVTSLFCGTITASAATSKASLLSLDITKIDSKATGIGSLGQDLYLLYSDSYRAVYRIGNDEIKKWRSSGKLKATKITVDTKANKNNWTYYSDATLEYSDYMIINSGDDLYVLKYEKSQNKLKEIYKTTHLVGVSGNGYIFEFTVSADKSNTVLKILNNSGKIVKKIQYDHPGNDIKVRNRAPSCGTEFAFTTYYKDSDVSEKGMEAGNVTIIDNNGKSKTISKYCAGNVDIGNNYFAFEYIPMVSIHAAYLTEKNKCYYFKDISGYETGSYNANYKYYGLTGFIERFYGTKAIGIYQYTDYSDPNNKKYEYKYALVNVKTDKFITAKYDDMSTYDNGETFLIQDSKGQWGYLNAKGKKLAMFTDAAAFYGSGKYAPVIKGGNIYLIDKNMKQVSKTIKSDKDSVITTLGDELFKYTKGGKNYIMTNK